MRGIGAPKFRWLVWQSAAALFCAAVLLPGADGSALAQGTTQSGEEFDTREPAVESERAETAAEAEERVYRLLNEGLSSDTGTVTYADLLKDPDNPALNIAYARQQIAKKRFKSAASTLERLLLIAPKANEVRLLYALVLIELNSLDAAERELTRLSSLEMTPALRAQLTALLDRIADARSRWELSLITAAGAAYDWNVNSVPQDRVRLFGGVPATLNDDSARIGDVSFSGLAQWDMAYDLGYQARHQAVGRILYYIDDQVIHDPIDISTLGVEAGVRLRFPDLILTPKIGHTALWLSREQYFSAYKASLDYELALPPDMKLFGRAAYSHERYYEITETSTGPAQNGPRAEASVGLETDLDLRNRVSLSYGAGVKRGVPLHEHRFYHHLTFAYQHLFEHGGFFTGRFRLGQMREVRPDPSDDPNRKRRDITGRLRLGYGIAIGRLVDLSDADPRLAQGLGKTVASVGAELYRSTSTVRNYRYWNRRAEFLLTRKWNF